MGAQVHLFEGDNSTHNNTFILGSQEKEGLHSFVLCESSMEG